MEDDCEDTKVETWDLRDGAGGTGIQGPEVERQHWTVVVNELVGRVVATMCTNVEITKHCHLEQRQDG